MRVRTDGFISSRLAAIRLAQTDDVHPVVARRENQDAQSPPNSAQYLETPLAVVAAEILGDP